jgi:hypothetical protein
MQSTRFSQVLIRNFLMEVYSADRTLRATILEGGEVKDENGVVVGYINEDGSAGDVYLFFYFRFTK